MPLNVSEIARLLDLPAATIHRWVRQGRIPVITTHPEPLFGREEIKRWATEVHMPIFPLGEDNEMPRPSAPSLLSALNRGGIYRNIPAGTVEEALRALSELAPIPEDQQKILLERLLQREELSSTGIGHQVAVPHPRRPLQGVIDEAVMVCAFLSRPIEYGAIDREPVRVLMMLLSPSTRVHLLLLSHLAFCLRDEDFRRVLSPENEDEFILKAIRENEALLEKSSPNTA